MTTGVNETAAARETGAPSTRSLADPRRTTWVVLMIFVAPALIVYGAMTAYPAFRTIWDSFFTIDGSDVSFVGLANYRDLAGDETFWMPTAITMRNTSGFGFNQIVWSFRASYRNYHLQEVTSRILPG